MEKVGEFGSSATLNSRVEAPAALPPLRCTPSLRARSRHLRAVLYWVIPYIVGSALIFGRRDTILGEVQERSSTEGAA